MKRQTLTYILVFILGMVVFAVGYFLVKTFLFPERPQPAAVIEDWGKICFWPGEQGMLADVAPNGCYSSTCTWPRVQAGSAVVDIQEARIDLKARFVLEEPSPFLLPCSEDCAGGGTVQFQLGALLPNRYTVWFCGQPVGEVNVYSGRPTPRQCFENTD